MAKNSTEAHQENGRHPCFMGNDPEVEEICENDDDHSGLEEILSAHLARAQQALQKEHQAAIVLVARHLETRATDNMQRPNRETDHFRAWPPSQATPGDMAAATTPSCLFSGGSKGKLRFSAQSEASSFSSMSAYPTLSLGSDLPQQRPKPQVQTVEPKPPHVAIPKIFLEPIEQESAEGAVSARSEACSSFRDSALSVCSTEDFQDKAHARRGAFVLLDAWLTQGEVDQKAMLKGRFTDATRKAKANLNFRMTAQDMDDTTFGLIVSDSVLQEDEGGMNRWVIHPYDARRSIFDITRLLLTLYDIIMIPMMFFEPENTAFLSLMTWTTRIFWTMDIPMSFVSGFVDAEGRIELRFRKISRKYMRGWLALDLLVVGVDWLELILSAASEGLDYARLGKAGRAFRILRMVRLLRLARMSEVAHLFTERFKTEKLMVYLDIAKLMVMMVGLGHLLGCFWFAVANSKDEGEKNWLDEYEFKDEGMDIRYVMSLRWALAQYAGGMDEVTPKSVEEHIYATLTYLVCFWSGAVVLAILTSSMTQNYIISSQQAQQVSQLRRYLAERGVSKNLAMRIQRNAQQNETRQQLARPEGAVVLIKKVSEPLKLELHFEMYTPQLIVHPFFKRYTSECPNVMRKVCHRAMTTRSVNAGERIFNIGEMPAEPKMYMVNQGELSYTSMFDGESKPVFSGRWISEHSLWVQWVHRGTLIACEDCLLYCVVAIKFQQIVTSIEHLDFDPRTYANSFLESLNETDDATDLELPNMGSKVGERRTTHSLRGSRSASRSFWFAATRTSKLYN